MTSGFNIHKNISWKKAFADILGFTREEILALIPQMVDTEKCHQSADEIARRMEPLYNGYHFSKKSEVSVFNSSMCMYYLSELAEEGEEPAHLLDPAFSQDLSKLDGILAQTSKTQIRSILERALKKEPIRVEDFPETINLNKHEFRDCDILAIMVSMGYLTFVPGDTNLLVIPNRAVAQQVFEFYLRRLLGTASCFLIKDFDAAFAELDIGNPHPFIEVVSAKFNETSGIHKNLHLTKSDFQTALQMAALFSADYSANTELEIRGQKKGVADLVLTPKDPAAHYTYLVEIKHLAKSGATAEAVRKASQEARTQLENYALGANFAACKLLKKVAVVYVGLELRVLDVF